MHRGAVDGLALLPNCQIVAERDRFAMGDEKPRQRAAHRRPGADLCHASRLVQIDRAFRPDLVAVTIRGQALLMASPAELGGLRAFAAEPRNAPGIDELA